MQNEQIREPFTLFYSCAPEDEALQDQLERQLSLLRRQRVIDDWHHRQIMPGAERTKEIDEHLETASIILLLISPDFLASDYCYETEMQRALERHRRGEVHVIPIILRPCDWHTAPFGDLQCLPHGGRAVTALLKKSSPEPLQLRRSSPMGAMSGGVRWEKEQVKARKAPI